MPSPRVQEYLDGLTDEDFRERRDHFYRTYGQAEERNFIEFLENLAFQDLLYEVSIDDQGLDHSANRAANGLGGLDYVGDTIPYSRKARDPRYGSGSSHGHSTHRGTVGRYPESHYGNEPFAGGGNGNHGSRTPYWTPNPYGPADSSLRFSTENPADLGGRDYGHQAAPPPRRSEMPQGERSTPQSSLADASSRHHGGRQDPRSHNRYESHDDWNANFGGSSGGHGGRHNGAGRRQ